MKLKIIKAFSLLLAALSLMLCAILNVCALEAADELDLEIDERAGAVYLYSYDADRVLLCTEPDQKIAPASSAKIMTGLIVCELYSSRLDEKVEITEEMLKGHSGASMNLRVGMRVTLRDLLYGTVCGGNNDAATALAIACSGSVSAFVNEMNFFAKHLYMQNTHYENPTGHDAKGAYTTLSDTALLVHKAAKNDIYMSASSAAYFDFTPEGEKTVTVNNRNALANRFTAAGYSNKYAKGIISGNTDEGGYVLAASAEKAGAKYLCLIMGAEADDKEIYSYYTANKLFDHVFDEYGYEKAMSGGEELLQTPVALSVSDGKETTLPCVLKEDLYVFVDVDTDVKDELSYVTYLHSDELSAPITKGSILGGVDVYCGDILVGRGELVAGEEIKPNLILYALSAMRDFLLGRTFIIFVIVFIPLLIIYLLIDAKRSRHKKVGTLRFKRFS
ncbi:MAG: D-alanyl-D-alanine carboxypeptidase [Clostridia bacterium]|nr:D-alanyl-D-alanine carboxypeptidase [Clostridia bacterium]